MNNEFSTLLKQVPFSIEETAKLLGFSVSTLYQWEQGKAKPREAAVHALKSILSKQPTKSFEGNENASFKFIDLFAGIGGIRLPFDEIGGECVFTSEWDKFAQRTYAVNFHEVPQGDITKVSAKDIPSHDLLLAGFPCQAFSQAGLRKGFTDTRGTMFFEIQKILAHHRPAAFLLENVKQLKGHDKGRTLETILDILQGQHEFEDLGELQISDEAREALQTKLNYWVDFRVLAAKDFGVPQNRERIFIVGFNKDVFDEEFIKSNFEWPSPSGLDTSVGNILFNNKDVDDKYTISDRLWAGHQRRKAEHKTKGNGFGYSLFNQESEYTNTISARYYKDGSEILIDQSDIGKNPRKLTPRECARLQGFPEDYIVDCVSDLQAYKQFGNSVSVPVIRAVANAMKPVLQSVNSLNKQPFKRAV